MISIKSFLDAFFLRTDGDTHTDKLRAECDALKSQLEFVQEEYRQLREKTDELITISSELDHHARLLKEENQMLRSAMTVHGFLSGGGRVQ